MSISKGLYCFCVKSGDGEKAPAQALPANRRVGGACESLSGSRRNKRLPQPVWLGRAGSMNCRFYESRFLRSQSNRKDDSRPFLRKPWPSHFTFHKVSYFRLRKCLTSLSTFVYKSPASKFEARSYEKLCPHVSVRLANRRHPAVTGAGNERLAMKDQPQQGGFVPDQIRSLKIQPVGDFWRKRIKPQILLTGNWLQRAGFKPGHRVQVIIEQPGRITLNFLEQVQEGVL